MENSKETHKELKDVLDSFFLAQTEKGYLNDLEKMFIAAITTDIYDNKECRDDAAATYLEIKQLIRKLSFIHQ